MWQCYFNIFKGANSLFKNQTFIKIIRNYSDACVFEKKGLLLGLYSYDPDCEEPPLTKSALKFNECSGGKLVSLIKRSGKRFNKGSVLLLNNVDKEFWSIGVVCIGPEKAGFNPVESVDDALENVRKAIGKGVHLLKKQRVEKICVESMGYPEQAGEGATLAIFRYEEMKQREKWKIVPKLELYDDPDQDAFQRGVFKGESQNWCRRLCEMPGNILTPLAFAQETVNELCPCGIKVQVHDKDWIEAKKFTAFSAVARGSCEPPIVMEISYCGGPSDQKPVVLVAKGTTFDCGGLCLKRPFKGMDMHRADMNGAGCAIAAIRAASALSLPLNIEVIVLLCENMISGMALKAGDIVTAMNGTTIRVADTDKEGRLMLADGLVYGQMIHSPNIIIDIGASCMDFRRSLGSAASGVFTNSEFLWEQWFKAGVITGDRILRFPLWEFFRKRVSNYRFVDLSNRGKGTGSPCNQAGFLSYFIKCVEWSHLDTTNVAYTQDHKQIPYLAKGYMTGRPTRTLIQFLYQLSISDKK